MRRLKVGNIKIDNLVNPITEISKVKLFNLKLNGELAQHQRLSGTSILRM